MIRKIRKWATPAFLVLCLLLGGASGAGAGAPGNALLQIVSIGVLAWFFLGSQKPLFPTEAKPILLLAAILIAWSAISLVPLPSSLWTGLPGRDPVTGGFDMLGVASGALPLSLAPQATLSSLAWLLPPAAMFALTLRADGRARRRLLWTLLVVAVVSAALGMGQMLAGPGTPLRFYRVTNPTEPVGFFSNANHLGTLLVCAIPVTGYLAARAMQRSSKTERRSGFGIAAAFAAFLLLGLGIGGSMAALGLAAVATVSVALIYRRAKGPLDAKWLGAGAAVFAVFVGLAVAGPLQHGAISEQVGSQSTSRATIALQTWEAIKDSFPVGTGLGTFPAVYRRYENPANVGVEFTNHAHNDWLELLLDLGVVGAVLAIGFLLWFAGRSLVVWRSSGAGGNAGRAASVMIVLVLLHSIVDYPLRTSAMAAVFALACGLLIPIMASTRRSTSKASDEGSGLRHLEAD